MRLVRGRGDGSWFYDWLYGSVVFLFEDLGRGLVSMGMVDC
jgi:hypothetical protein